MSQTGRWMFMSNLAPAISGAAVGLSQFDPKRSSREMKLRTWTPFIGNLDLGYVYPREPWDGEGMMYLSDGGHSENLGAYALIKRECRRIVIVDAEHEASIPYVFSGYSKLKRQLEEEQGLCLSVTSIDEYLAKCEGPQQPTQSSLSLMEGSVTTLLDDSDWSPNKVFYIKLGMERHRHESYPETVASYALKNDKFPQDPTTDQTFGSEQFVAYRDLGYHVAKGLSRNALMGSR